MPSAGKQSRVVTRTADMTAVGDYQAQGFEAEWCPKVQMYQILRPSHVGRKAKIPAAEHPTIRSQLAAYRLLREQARLISPGALARKHGVSQAVIERIDGGEPYKDFAPESDESFDSPSP